MDSGQSKSGAALGPDEVRFVPLGGLGEIGMNCFALEQRDGIIVVDCGTGFPNDDIGIDVYHPDFRWLRERAERVRGVFITHGHEDHIGGLPYLLDELPVPVFGPAHALGLARRRLEEHGFSPTELSITTAPAGGTYEVGPFTVEPVRVTHSIAEASALAIRTAAGIVLHTGDFNIDPDPPDGEPTDEARLRALGDEGVALLLSDSTNVDVEVRAGSERSVGDALDELVSSAPGRVVIAMFASNVQRLLLIGEIAKRSGRKLCVLGRSLNQHVENAAACGRLDWPSNLRVGSEQVASLPRSEVLVLAGGTQGERNSSMQRLAKGLHNDLKLEPGDRVIFSSRVIPGNERSVFELGNDLLRLGVEVRNRHGDPGVHTSGHACRREQRHMLQMVRPRAFVPVHGSLHHLRKHEALAREEGVTETRVVENGQSIRLARGRLSLDVTFHSGRVPIAVGGEPMSPAVVLGRQELGRGGLVAASIVLDKTGRLVGTPLVTSRGVPLLESDDGAIRAVHRAIAERFQRRPARASGVDLEDEIRRLVRRQVLDLTGSRPSIEVHVHWLR